MATYQGQGFDPRVYQVQGFQQDNQAIMAGLQAKTSYYVSVLNNIRNSDQQAFNLSLTNEQNRNNLMQDRVRVDNQLKSVVKNDLSIGDYQTQALDLYKPITTNQNYEADDHITKQVTNSLQESQSDSKNKGSNYLNVESVRSLHNTLNDLRQADTSQKGWANSLMSDPLGLQYVPYDPKVDKDYEASKVKFLKDTMSKYSSTQTQYDSYNPDGTPAPNAKPVRFLLSDKEIATQTERDMQGWISENQPQQQKVNIQLRAKNLAYDYKQAIQNDPINAPAQIAQNLTQIKTNAYNSDITVLNRTINHLISAQVQTLPGTPAFDAIQKQVDDLKGPQKNDIDAFYKGIDPQSIIKEQGGYQQLSALLNRSSINSQVLSLGLDRTSETIKADQSATSLQNNREAIQARLQVAALQSQTALLKAKGKNPDGTDITNPNITASTDLAPDVTRTAAQKVQDIQQQYAINDDESRKALLSDPNTFKAVVNVGGRNINILDAANLPQYRNLPFEDFLNKPEFRLSDNIKTLLQGLFADAYVKNDINKTIRGAAGNAAPRILAALYDANTLSAVLKRAGLETGNEDFVADLGISLQDNNNRRNNIANTYGQDIHAAVSAIPEFNSMSNDKLIDMTAKGFAEHLSPRLKELGYSDSDIEDVARVFNGEMVNNPRISKQYSSGVYMGPGMGTAESKTQTVLNDNILGYKQAYTLFKDKREAAIQNSGRSLLANTTSFQIDQTPPGKDESSIDFDKGTIHAGIIPSLLSQATGTIDGTPQGDPDALAAFDRVKGQLAPYLSSMQVFDNNTKHPYLHLQFNKDIKDFLKNADLQGIDDADDLAKQLSSTRFYIPRSDLTKYGFGVQSQAALDLSNDAGTYDYSLTSGNKFWFKNVGMDGQTNVSPEGAFDDIDIVANGRNITGFNIVHKRRFDNSLLAKNGIPEAAMLQNPHAVAHAFYTYDYRSALIQQILKDNNLQGDNFTLQDLQKLPQRDQQKITNILNRSVQR